MAYKWKPNTSQRAAFKERMQDPIQKQEYESRRRLKKSYEGFKEKSFVPSKAQYEYTLTNFPQNDFQHEGTFVQSAFTQVQSAYLMNEKTHHDNIHIVNMFIRGELNCG